MYPPEPWHLEGQLYLSVWTVPRAALPPLPGALGAAVRPVSLGGRAVVGTAWVRYGPGGTLQYRELLSAVLVRHGHRLAVTIMDIWVDSPASRDGGRALWGIPKDLADLTISASPPGTNVSAEAALPAASPSGGPVPAGARRTVTCAATVSPGRRLPGRWPFAMRTAQLLAGAVKTTPVRGRTGLRFGAAAWRADPDGPLRYLAGRRPRLTVLCTDFALTFGTVIDGGS